MPRAEVGTQKWLANKMKAKGLQKLRWYCQMCEKQCRDENGFKCHRMSESHQRQMQVFCQNPNRFMDDFSREFERAFMKLMRTRYCRTRILANSVYTEMIAHKEHIHMNSTIWVTLSEFVQYLGQSGKCKIDYTEKGWFLEYIDREKIERERAAMLKRKQELTIEEMNNKRIESLVLQAKSQGAYQQPQYSELKRSGTEKIVLNNINKAPSSEPIFEKKNTNIFAQHYNQSIKSEQKSSKENSTIDQKKPLSNLDKLMVQNETKKRKLNDFNQESIKKQANSVELNLNNNSTLEFIKDQNPSCWINPGLIVKIVDPQYNSEAFFNKKARILEVDSHLLNANLQILNSDETLTIGQNSLETVIPNINGPVQIVAGKYKGFFGNLLEVDKQNLLVKVKLSTSNEGESTKIIDALELEEICKYN